MVAQLLIGEYIVMLNLVQTQTIHVMEGLIFCLEMWKSGQKGYYTRDLRFETGVTKLVSQLNQ